MYLSIHPYTEYTAKDIYIWNESYLPDSDISCKNASHSQIEKTLDLFQIL